MKAGGGDRRLIGIGAIISFSFCFSSSELSLSLDSALSPVLEINLIPAVPSKLARSSSGGLYSSREGWMVGAGFRGKITRDASVERRICKLSDDATPEIGLLSLNRDALLGTRGDEGGTDVEGGLVRLFFTALDKRSDNGSLLCCPVSVLCDDF